MSFMIVILIIIFIVGMIGLASNPSPYFGALSLVLAAIGGCGVLASYGGSFISLVFLLIYLGGMLVVFAYCAALSSEPFPEGWGDWSVIWRIVGCLGIVFVMAFLWGGNDFYCGIVDEFRGFSVLRGEFSGVSFIYYLGGEMLILCGFALLLTLFVVLELTRGTSRGALRAI
uniref:NADH-ubiquinone oxidoreductase chain 6 n=1 Tax=Muraenesox cinereus TaxID=7946 RepID=A0A891T4Y8_MURCI|nr:NADH dehydrogenase subunit 6 [Muraenesox cinereus]QRM91347.1 NADH dehydrogenase subunit 6 [Muraenesox cinereus]